MLTVIAPMLDKDHFQMMTGGDVALQGEVAGLFRGQTGPWRAALADADAPDQWPDSWRVTMHTIKGSARGIGLWPLAEACERAEKVDREAAPAARAEVLSLLDTALESLAAY